MYSMKHRSHIERRAHELNETQRLTKEIEEKKDEMEAVTERRNQLRGTRGEEDVYTEIQPPPPLLREIGQSIFIMMMMMMMIRRRRRIRGLWGH